MNKVNRFKKIHSITYKDNKDEQTLKLHEFGKYPESFTIETSSYDEPDYLVIPIYFNNNEIHDYDGDTTNLTIHPINEMKQNPQKNKKSKNITHNPLPDTKYLLHNLSGRVQTQNEWYDDFHKIPVSMKEYYKIKKTPIFEKTLIQVKLNDDGIWERIIKNPNKKKKMKKNPTSKNIVSIEIKNAKKPTTTQENRLLREYLLSHKNIRISPQQGNKILREIGKKYNIPTGERYIYFKKRISKNFKIT